MPVSLEHRLQILVSCLRQIYRKPFKTWFSILLGALMLSMPTGLYLTAQKLEFFSFLMQQQPEVIVFLARDADHSATVLTQQRIEQLSNVKSTQLVSAEQALADFEQLTGLSSVSHYLQENPFPAVILVRLGTVYSKPQDYEPLLSEIQQSIYVDQVQFDREWAAKLNALRHVIQLFAQAVIVVFFLAVGALVVNISRRQVFFRTDEIRLLALIGAGRRFIYRPFIYLAILQSLLIVSLAFIIVESFLNHLKPSISELITLYQIDASAAAIQWNIWGIVLAVVLVLNIVAVRFTVYLHARQY